MSNRIKTLLIYANGGYGWKTILVDTTLRGLLRIKWDAKQLPGWLARYSTIQKLFGHRTASLSYVNDWQEAFCQAPELEVDPCNLNDLFQYGYCLKNIARYDFIVILHSATGNNMSLLLKTAQRFHKRRGKLLVFIGNEYSLMLEKIGFLKLSGADYVGSQLPLKASAWLYGECTATRVLETPHALNPDIYRCDPAIERTVDIGFIGDIYPYFIGDLERTNIIRLFQRHGAEMGLNCQILGQRLARSQWVKFLSSCKGIIGAEAGTYFLERDDQTTTQVKAFLKQKPGASFEEVYERFFKGWEQAVSGKCISSRHFEAIGTRTCQLLVEGSYNGILKADEHYISIKKDLSNVQEAVQRFKDETYRASIVNSAYDWGMANHTYRHRVNAILRAIFPSGRGSH